MFELKRVVDGVYVAIFENQEDLASTFLRFQEFYESPEFKGKIFTLEEFKRWYVKSSAEGQKTGTFTYYSDWSGFNIPSYIFEPFLDGKFDPLSEKEKVLIEKLKEMFMKNERFYLIGVFTQHKDFSGLLIHEVAHGLFYVDGDYRRKVLTAMRDFDLEIFKKKIYDKGSYHPDVLEDEAHAYTLAPGKLREFINPQFREILEEIFFDTLKKHNPSEEFSRLLSVS